MSILERYGARLPQVEKEFHCSLGEGNTPLLASRVIGPELGLKNLFFKCEHQNPSGSYKDRFVALELSILRQSGARYTVATSSGNTGSSLAAYAARYNVPCHLFVCEKTPSGKLLQMKAHGANVYRVRGFCLCRETSQRVMDDLYAITQRDNSRPAISAFSFAPEGMQGVSTIAFEIEEQLDAIGLQAGHVFTPGGGCGLYLAISRGFASGNTSPRVHLVQPRLNDTAVTAIREGRDAAMPSSTTTTISGLAVPQVLDGDAAIAAARQNGGSGFLIEDSDAFYWQQKMLREEGVWIEPAGAVSIAGLATAVREGAINTEEPVVCVLTGHGFKDPSSALPQDEPETMIEPGDIAGILA